MKEFLEKMELENDISNLKFVYSKISNKKLRQEIWEEIQNKEEKLKSYG